MNYDRREFIYGIEYFKFAALAKKLRLTAQELAGVFRGKFETTMRDTSVLAGGESMEHYFNRILHGEPNWEVMIPFVSVITFFLKNVQLLRDDGKISLCPCGCGSYAGGGNNLAWSTCRYPVAKGFAKP